MSRRSKKDRRLFFFAVTKDRDKGGDLTARHSALLARRLRHIGCVTSLGDLGESSESMAVIECG